MAMFDQGGGCACGLRRVCDCLNSEAEPEFKSARRLVIPDVPPLPLVGFTGPGGVGKSTVAKSLMAAWRPDVLSRATSLDPAILHIGQPLKAMLVTLLRHAGLSTAEADYWVWREGKRLPCPALGGRTPTHAMQTLGTEWGRDNIAPELWLEIWRVKARAKLAEGRMVINDSVRFDNEAQAIRDLGGLVVRITGRAGDLAAGHVSERGVQPDLEVENLDGRSDAAALSVMAALAARGVRAPATLAA